MSEPAPGIDVRVNGRVRTLPAGATVADLLRELGLAGPLVAVERNREVVPRLRHGEVRVQAGDTIEVVQFVGGG